MSGRLYTVVFDSVSIPATNAMDLFVITPADDKICVIHGFTLSNVGGTADAGDAQEELLRLSLIRGFTSIGSGGTTPTPAALGPGNAAAGFTAHVNDTTVATTGTTATLFTDGWNIRIPYQMFFTPECRPVVTQQSTTALLRLVTGPADAVSCSGTLFVEEIGG